MTRERAYEILTELIKNPNLIKHHLSAEAVMIGIANVLKQKDPSIIIEDWGLTGLLHDADYEMTKDIPEKHTAILEEKLKSELKPEIMHAIKSHAYGYNDNGVTPQSHMDWAMYTCDELTGFIIACALVRPNKKLQSVNTDIVLKKLNEPGFARAVNRDQIKMCEEKLGIPIAEFIKIAIESMQKISAELGL